MTQQINVSALFMAAAQRRLLFQMHLRHLVAAVSAALVLPVNSSLAEGLTIDTVKLPALRINGKAAAAHTQGLEVVAGHYYVSARREDLQPKRALLLRTKTTGMEWDVWDVTPAAPAGSAMMLDHPGGMQSDGSRLWIPCAESKRKGRSLIRAFSLASMTAGQPLKPEFEFSVDDHIGAVAVATGFGLLFGANWDTETVYVWDLEGRLKRTLGDSTLAIRGLGASTASGHRAGVAVQDWKVIGDRLFASGLFRARGTAAASPRSRFLSFANFLETDFERRIIVLPLQMETEPAREAMAISDGLVYFLPEDLGATNRLFRVALADLLKRAVSD